MTKFPELMTTVKYLSKVDNSNEYEIKEGKIIGTGYTEFSHPMVQILDGEVRKCVELAKLDVSEEFQIKLIDADMRGAEVLSEAKKEAQGLINKRDKYNETSQTKLNKMQEEIQAFFDGKNAEHNKIYDELFNKVEL